MRTAMACCGRQQTRIKEVSSAAAATAAAAAVPAPPLAPEAVAAAGARPARRRAGAGGAMKGPQPKMLLRAAKDGDAATMEQLLNAGLDIEHRGMWGNNPLLCACAYGSDEVAALLLRRGAKVAVENEDGATALMLGCLEGLVDAIGLMLAASGPDGLQTLWPEAVIVYNKDCDSSSPQTPLRAACENGHVGVLQSLLAHAAPGVLESAPEGAVAEAVVAAARQGHVAVLEALSQAGVAVGSATNGAGKTAMEVGTVEITDYLQALARLKGLTAGVGSGDVLTAQPNSSRAAEAVPSLAAAPPPRLAAAPPPLATVTPPTAMMPRPPPADGVLARPKTNGPPRGARQLKPLNAPPPTVVQENMISGLLPAPPPAVR